MCVSLDLGEDFGSDFDERRFEFSEQMQIHEWTRKSLLESPHVTQTRP
jgi:hypothetical protein